MLLGRLRDGPDRDHGPRRAGDRHPRVGRLPGPEGELGVLSPGAAGDLVCWPLDGLAFAGALTDPVEAWLRCGPVAARHTVVAGDPVVQDGVLVRPGVDDMLRRHRAAAARMPAAHVAARPYLDLAGSGLRFAVRLAFPAHRW